MSNVKRGEILPGQLRGPFYSRYTEHKVAFCFQSSDDNSAVQPIHYLSNVDQRYKNSLSDSPLADSVSGSFDKPLSHSRSGSSDQQNCIIETCTPEFPYPVSRGSSSDSFQSSLRASPLEFRPVSPRLTVNEDQVTSFRRDSSDFPATSVSTGILGDSAREKRNAYFEKNSSVNNNCCRGKFANLVGKHSVNILTAAVFKAAHEKSRRKQLTHSCPDLITSRPSDRESAGRENTQKTVSIGELGKYSTEHTDQIPTRKNKLGVPDIFTTSFTHSPPKQPTRSNTLSLQDISVAAKRQNKEALRRTISLTKNLPENLKSNQIGDPSMYRDEQISQITDYLFIGTIESAFNERRLCRLDIESLVDISNLSEMQVPSHRKIQCPCLCQTEFKHFRSRLIIAVADEENENIDQYFEEVSRFIEGARRCSKKVLIYSFEGKSRSALFAIQYLMAYEGLLLRQAYNVVKKQRPQVSLNPSFQKALEKLEKSLFPDEKHSVNFCNEYLNVADPQAIKCAWIDC